MRVEYIEMHRWGLCRIASIVEEIREVDGMNASDGYVKILENTHFFLVLSDSEESAAPCVR